MARGPFPTQNIALAGVATRYAGINRDNRGYIADMVAPRIRVPSQLFRWYRDKVEDAFTVTDDQIDRIGQANEITKGWAEDTGSTVDHALREPVPYADEAEAAAQGIPWNLRQDAAETVTDRVQLNREIRVANLAMSSSSYGAGYVTDLTSGTKWTDFTNSDPVAAILDAKRKMLIRPNVGVTSGYVMDILQRHPKVAVALGGSLNSGMIYPVEAVARVLGLSKILIGDTIAQTSKPGQSLTTGGIWPNSFALHYQSTTDMTGLATRAKVPNFLATFQWLDWVAAEETYAPGTMGLRGGVKVLVGESVVEKQISPYAGYLFQNVLP